MRATSTDALVLVDKPAGVTSFDVVREVGRAIGTRRVGHAGTLDPFATGLLVVLAGRATRCIRFVPVDPKVYLATLTFGSERDTDDATGLVVREGDAPVLERVLSALPALTGTVSQVPPDYSAKKVAGERAYAKARRGERVPLAAVSVTVHGWEVVSWENPRLVVRVTCGSGTYIRALARDLGRLCESAAHLETLRRERSGPFRVEEAISLGAIKAGGIGWRDARDALGTLPCETVDMTRAARVLHGAPVPAEGTGDAAVVVVEDVEGRWLGMATRRAGMLHPEVVLNDG